MPTGTPPCIGKYLVEGLLGNDALGPIYAAVDPPIGRRVALRTIAWGSLAPEELRHKSGCFRRAMEDAGRLNHPGIVTVYDCGEERNFSYVAMQYVQGHSLKRILDVKGPIGHCLATQWTCEILDVLDHTHGMLQVHKDIQPANIFISDGRVKVAGFNLARVASWLMGIRIEKAAYLSPEQHRELPLDSRSDIFSTGVILYELLTGSRPFIGDAETMIRQILAKDFIPPSAIDSSIPRAIDEVIGKALAGDANRRFRSARVFAQALRWAAKSGP